jgi:class 3 adenylate cyclase
MEAAFLSARLASDVAVVRGLLGAALAAYALNATLAMVRGTWNATGQNLVDVAAIALLCLFIWATTRKWFENHRESMVFFANITFVVVDYFLIASRPSELHLYMSGIVHLHILCSSLMPYRFSSKVMIATAAVVSYFACVISHGAQIDGILVMQVVHLSAGVFISMAAGTTLEKNARTQFLLQREIALERQKTEDLLHTVLPRSIADKLRDCPDGAAIVHEVKDVGVLFADLVGFTRLAATRPAGDVANILNEIFSLFDEITKRIGAQKIKTIGDCYMAVAGIPDPVKKPAETITQLAFELRAATDRYSAKAGLPIAIRIGVHSGPAAAGVIGKDRFHYDLWGDTVNMAARLESTAAPGQIHASKTLVDQIGSRFRGVARGTVDIKGFGLVSTWTLEESEVLKTDRASSDNRA